MYVSMLCDHLLLYERSIEWLAIIMRRVLMTSDSGANTLCSVQKLLRIVSGGLVLLLIFLLMGGCEQRVPGVGSPDGALYIDKCGLCHPAPMPQKYTFKVWKGIIPTMEEKVKATGQREPLTEEEMKSILNYFKKHSKRII